MRHFRGDGHDHRPVGVGCALILLVIAFNLLLLGAAVWVVVEVLKLTGVIQ